MKKNDTYFVLFGNRWLWPDTFYHTAKRFAGANDAKKYLKDNHYSGHGVVFKTSDGGLSFQEVQHKVIDNKKDR
jgi:hypothetical protein